MSNGCKSRVSPNSGNHIAKGKGVHREVESAESREQLRSINDGGPMGPEETIGCRLWFFHYFPQRGHDEVPFVHAGMRQGECGRGELQVSVEKQIDVDGTVVIYAVLRFFLAPQLTFYPLCGPKALVRRQCGLHETGGIEEGMLALESPGLCLDERRDTLHRANTLVNQRNGTAQHLGPVSKIGA